MSTGTTIAFPHSLREDIEAGTANHISFQILGAGLDENVFKIHLYIPENLAVADQANFGNLSTGIFNEVETIANNKEGQDVKEAELRALGLGASIIQNLGLDQFGVSEKKLLDAGVAKNDATVTTFEGSNIRQFAFSFKKFL